ncbi:TPA: hypothetical protein N0F65_011096 [Lagenidium giganteum]|uniref:Uncharacterized protein n=1 Tax=Lagenidium giganteum TaxID=4803 RepID=A0AAV2ZII9_9STRA|nr:TPA: hypothetical protein N0F65_011096 [Lagenidium giganteum]
MVRNAAELRRFMTFLGREQELSEASFTSAALANIAPADIVRYFNCKAFGTENPGETCRPTKARSNTLKSCKTMLSAFMPMKNMPWDEIRKEGNPTRSSAVNMVIKRVQKFEWHLIGRIDDMMKLQFENLAFNPTHPFTLMEENNFLHSSPFLFGNGVDGDRGVRSMLNVVFKSTDFARQLDGNLETHSFRKGSTSYCARNGIPKDSIEMRGRWKGNRKYVDVYIDVE